MRKKIMAAAVAASAAAAALTACGGHSSYHGHTTTGTERVTAEYRVWADREHSNPDYIAFAAYHGDNLVTVDDFCGFAFAANKWEQSMKPPPVDPEKFAALVNNVQIAAQGACDGDLSKSQSHWDSATENGKAWSKEVRDATGGAITTDGFYHK